MAPDANRRPGELLRVPHSYALYSGPSPQHQPGEITPRGRLAHAIAVFSQFAYEGEALTVPSDACTGARSGSCRTKMLFMLLVFTRQL